MNTTLRNLLIGVAAAAFIIALGFGHFLYINDTYEPGDSLNLAERVTVYTGHAVMVYGGYSVGLTEVAEEAMFLHFNGPERRRWASSFPATSPRVRAAMTGMKGELKSGAPRSTRTVQWPGYTPANARQALALNSFDIVATTTEDGMILYRGVVHCSYPEDGPARLDFGLFTVTLNEGVYHALQDAGWLYPYRAVWWWEESTELDVNRTASVAGKALRVPAARHVGREWPNGVGIRLRTVNKGLREVPFE
jgi:hypothetical protein